MKEKELQVNQEFFIAAPIANVWNFLISEQKMSTWLNAEEFVIDIWDGGGFEFPFSFQEHQCHIIGEVTILLEHEKYTLTWWEREPPGEEWMNCTTVTLNMKEENEGTQISLVHNGFKYLPSEIWGDVVQRYSAYWHSSGILERLASLVIAES